MLHQAAPGGEEQQLRARRERQHDNRTANRVAAGIDALGLQDLLEVCRQCHRVCVYRTDPAGLPGACERLVQHTQVGERIRDLGRGPCKKQRVSGGVFLHHDPARRELFPQQARGTRHPRNR